MATVWACRYLKRYLLFAVKVYCYLPGDEWVRVVQDRDVHLRVRAYLLDLAFYQVEWKVGRTMFSQHGGMFDWDNVGAEPGEEPTPVVQHVGRELKRPTGSRKLPPALTPGTHFTFHFDGGCTNRQGTGGWVLFAPDMSVIMARAEWFADHRPTVNTAEMAALLTGLNAVR
jgi:hypothetical protein